MYKNMSNLIFKATQSNGPPPEPPPRMTHQNGMETRNRASASHAFTKQYLSRACQPRNPRAYSKLFSSLFFPQAESQRIFVFWI